MKVEGRGCFYHVYNRVAGRKDEFPLTEADREKGFELLALFERFYCLELVAACWMGNHFHVVLYAPGEAPSKAEAAARWNAFYGKRRMPLNPTVSPGLCEQAAADMIDISHFMRQYQQAYARYVNKAHNRRGTLWADRFKSTILEGERALWNCVKYVELNPVRARLCGDPADYRWCSWGRYCGSGRHPFAAAVGHLRRSLGGIAGDRSESRVIAELRGELARTIAAESGADSEAIHAAKEVAKREPTLVLTCLRRSRYWTDGAIIGSKAFVQRVGGEILGPARMARKRLARGPDSSGAILHSYRLLRAP
jgi:REP element-mobilizing transposase RayT